MKEHTKKSCFTRTCIAEALLLLMKEKPLKEITVTALVERAGVSRMTYYKYFTSTEEVLEDYLYEMVKKYIREISEREDVGHFHDYVRIQYSFAFFGEYHEFFEILLKSNLYSIIINAVNQFMEEFVLKQVNHTKYELYYYAGALCNTFAKWIEDGRREPIAAIAKEIENYMRIEKKSID
ncbi:transcriptional regulator, TetR family [Lachnospiraceae bacterium KM106-2]|nr:transcriptional regulator, TetR family [Lachnospiraceae bacterium KM106-2]